MPISKKGWELHVERLTLHKSGDRKRTYGHYQVYVDGKPQPGLSGYMCERVGPGDNTSTGVTKHRRIEAGRYQLTTQFGKYRSIGYSTDQHTAGTVPMPGFRLDGTGARSAILVHPGHPPSLYLSSIGCFNPTEQIAADEVMSFWDSRRRVIAILDSLKAFAPNAFQHEVNTGIAGAFIVVDGEPMSVAKPAPAFVGAAALKSLAASALQPASLPISETAAQKCTRWLWQNFKGDLRAAVKGKRYSVSHLAAIVCQETAYKWVPWIDKLSVKTIVERAVYDASGDDPSSPRDAFPRNTTEFRKRFGKAFTDMLIDEANKTRKLQGWGPKSWVYKGYGLFQYDLQHVLTDQAFFEEKQWYDFSTCVAKCTLELDRKLVATHGDLWKAIRAYNGSGPRAQRYMENVRYFEPICARIVGATDHGSMPGLASASRKPRGVAATAAAVRTLSGIEWVSRFPTSASLDDLDPAFRKACSSFLSALRQAGASVEINATRRPRERAYLMNCAWRIAKDRENPQSIEHMPGVDIEWVHHKPNGSVDLAASRKAANAMVDAYDIAFKPALNSNHIQGKAIDMTIAWSGKLEIINGKGTSVTITSGPRNGMNQALWSVGSSFGVKKLVSDRPHWSANGH